MPTPKPRHERRSEVEPYIEEGTFYSSETVNGEPVRTYRVRRVDVGHWWSYEVSMEMDAWACRRGVRRTSSTRASRCRTRSFRASTTSSDLPPETGHSK